jgi:hypothetical protein
MRQTACAAHLVTPSQQTARSLPIPATAASAGEKDYKLRLLSGRRKLGQMGHYKGVIPNLIAAG